MNRSAYNFEHCKLCGRDTAAPLCLLLGRQLYRCLSCDFHTLNVLDDEPLTSETLHLDDRSRHYIESRLGESRHLHPERLKLVSGHLELSGIKALDIGAGLGQFQKLISAAGGQGMGIEPSSLRRQYAAEKFSVKLIEARAEDDYWQQSFREEFDLITLWDVIEHVNFPRETLEAAVRLLKPGGVLALETPSRDVMAYRLSLQACRLSRGTFGLYLPNFYSAAPYGHKQIFTRQQLVTLLNEAGLEIVALRHFYRKSLFQRDKLIVVAEKQLPG